MRARPPLTDAGYALPLRAAAEDPTGRTGPPRLLGAAVLIAIATVASRVVGFGRWLVFSHTVGAGSLADAYNSANQLPNIVFEITAGGALAGVAVPLLAGPLTGGGDGPRRPGPRLAHRLGAADLDAGGTDPAVGLRRRARGADGAHPRQRPRCRLHRRQISRFLIFFLPQIPLYGAAVVLGATLQADRRFLAPALAPLLSSLVVIASYTVFAVPRPRAAALTCATCGTPPNSSSPSARRRAS